MLSGNRAGHRSSRSKSFQPGIEGTSLETRVLLSNAHARKANLGGTIVINQPRTAAAGSAVIVTTPSAQQFYIGITGHGTVRAIATAGGAYSLIVQGTDTNSQLTISPLLQHRFRRGIAHFFSPGNTTRNTLVTISGINVESGTIGAILGYHTAVLTGPIISGGANQIDRIALYQIQKGGSISVGGDVNTLDVYNNAILDGTTGIYIGRDLNWLNVGGSLGLFNGANFTVGRDVGLVGQPLKGTEIGINVANNTTVAVVLQGGLVQGDMVIGATSKFSIGRSLDALFQVRGTVYGVTSADSSRISIPNGASYFQSLGGYQAFNGG